MSWHILIYQYIVAALMALVGNLSRRAKTHFTVEGVLIVVY